jgi:hypothetical protein
MPDKRFLGLGFTFAATDKGLEKKLTTVSKTLSQISETIDEINAGSAKMSGSLSRIRTPKAASSVKSSARRSVQVSPKKDDCCERLLGFLKKNWRSGTRAPMREALKSEPRRSRVMVDDGERKLSADFGKLEPRFLKNTRAFMKNLKQSTDPKLYDSFIAKLQDVRVTFTKTKNGFIEFTDETQEQLTKILAQYIQMAPLAEVTGINLKKATVALKAFGSYLSDVGSSVKELAESVGFNISKMIPPQFYAALGVVKSVISGPIKLIKLLADKSREKFDKKIRLEMLKSLGKGTTSKNVNKLLEKIAGELEGNKKEKGSILSPILAGLGIVAAALIGPFYAMIKAVKSAGIAISELSVFKESKIASKIAEWSGKIAESFKGLVKAFEFAKWIGKLAEGSVFLRVLKIFGKIGEMAGKFVPLLGEILILWDAFSAIRKAVEDSTGVFDFLRKAVLGFVDNLLIGLPSKLLGPDLWKKIYGPTKEEMKTTPIPATSTSVTTDSTTPMAAMRLQQGVLEMNQKTADAMKDQVRLQQENNDLIQQLIDKMSGKKDDSSGKWNVMLGFDARKYGISLDQASMAEAAANGTG